MSKRMWPEGTEFLTGADTEHSWVRLDQAIARITELEEWRRYAREQMSDAALREVNRRARAKSQTNGT